MSTLSKSNSSRSTPAAGTGTLRDPAACECGKETAAARRHGGAVSAVCAHAIGARCVHTAAVYALCVRTVGVLTTRAVRQLGHTSTGTLPAPSARGAGAAYAKLKLKLEVAKQAAAALLVPGLAWCGSARAVAGVSACVDSRPGRAGCRWWGLSPCDRGAR